MASSPALSALPGGGYLVAWSGAGDLAALRLDGLGQPAGSPVALPAGTIPRVAVGTSTFGVAWLQGGGWGAAGIDLDAGTILGTLYVGAAPRDLTSFDIAFDGSRYLFLTSVSVGGVWVSTIDEAFINIGSRQGLLYSGCAYPAAEFAADSGMLVCSDGRVKAAPLQPDLASALPRFVGLLGSAQRRPALAFAGDVALAVWDVEHLEGTGSRLVLIDVDGGLPRGPVTRVSESRSFIQQSFGTAITWDGRGALASWAERSGNSRFAAYARRIDLDGDAGPVLPLSAASGPTVVSAPRLASNGAGLTWAVWSMTTDAGERIAAVRVSDGGVAGTDRVLFPEVTGEQQQPAIAFGAERFLVAWVEERRGSIHAGFLGAGPDGVDAGTVAIGSAVPEGIALASNDAGFLIAWHEYPDAGPRVLFRRLAADGTHLDPAPRVLDATAFRSIAAPANTAAAFDGTNYVVAYDLPTLDGGFDLFVRRVFPDGGVERAATVLTATPFEEQEVALIATHPGTVLAAWSRFVPAAEERRVFARLISSDAWPSAGGGSAAGGGTGGGGGGSMESGGGSAVGGGGGGGGGGEGGGASGGDQPDNRPCGCTQPPAPLLAIALALLTVCLRRRR